MAQDHYHTVGLFKCSWSRRWGYDCWWSRFPRGQLIGLSLPAASLFWSPIGGKPSKVLEQTELLHAWFSSSNWTCSFWLGQSDYMLPIQALSHAICSMYSQYIPCPWLQFLQILMILLCLKYEGIRNGFQSVFVGGENKSFSYLSGLSSLIKGFRGSFSALLHEF